MTSRPSLIIIGITLIVLLGVGIPFGVASYIGLVPEIIDFRHGTIREVFSNGTVIYGGESWMMSVNTPAHWIEREAIGYSITVLYERSVRGERTHVIVHGYAYQTGGEQFFNDYASEWVK